MGNAAGGIIKLQLNKAYSGLWLKVDANRRRSDPRKPAKTPVSMVRFRCKSCLPGIIPVETGGSEGVVPERDLQQASVGSKTRSAE